MTTPTPDISDVVVIGAGIVGAAIARDLAGTGLSVDPRRRPRRRR